MLVEGQEEKKEYIVRINVCLYVCAIESESLTGLSPDLIKQVVKLLCED